MDDKFKIVLGQIPEILASEEDLEQNFEKIVSKYKSVVDFDNAYICYLNAGCANIQFKKSYSEIQPIPATEMVINFPEVLKTKLYDSTIIKFDEKSGFYKALGLIDTNSTFFHFVFL